MAVLVVEVFSNANRRKISTDLGSTTVVRAFPMSRYMIVMSSLGSPLTTYAVSFQSERTFRYQLPARRTVSGLNVGTGRSEVVAVFETG